MSKCTKCGSDLMKAEEGLCDYCSGKTKEAYRKLIIIRSQLEEDYDEEYGLEPDPNYVEDEEPKDLFDEIPSLKNNYKRTKEKPRYDQNQFGIPNASRPLTKTPLQDNGYLPGDKPTGNALASYRKLIATKAQDQAIKNMKENTKQMQKDPDFPKDKKKQFPGDKKDKGYPAHWGGGAK